MLSEKVEGEGAGLKAKLAARFKKRPEESPEKKKQQLQDYTAWVNNYLRRKPGAPLVSDLRWSLGDGVVFVHLVEIVAKVQVVGVERWPSSAVGRRLNTERALEFLRGDGVVLHQDACRDLLEGNVKGVMRVILAIAERYQPKSVKPRTEPARTPNHTAPLPDSAHFPRQEVMRPYTHPQIPEQTVSPSFHSGGYSSQYQVDPAQEGMYSCPIDQLPTNKPPQVVSGRKKAPPTGRGRTASVGVAGMYGIPEESLEEWEGPVVGGVVRGEGPVVGGVARGEGLAGEIGAVVSGLGQFKTELLQLHAILLRNNNGVRDVGGALGGASGDVGGGGMREKDLEEEVASLREQLSHLQDEYTQTEAECGALRSMVEERNAFITTMKSEIYRKEYLNDTQKAELHTQLLQKDTHIKKLETELADCHGNLEAKEEELEGVRGDLERSQAAVKQNRDELDHLRGELGKVSANEEKLGQKLLAREKKLAAAEERLGEERERGTRRIQQISEDLDALAEGLSQLTSDPGGQLEDLKKRVGEAAGRLDQPPSPSRRRRSEDHSRHRRKRRGDRQQEPHPPPATPNTTRVLYHMAGDTKTDVPFVAIVPKKSDEVTLGDFKAAFGRHGDFRFFFKTEDPDCGVVKEELTSNDNVLPSLKGKVTAWIQEREGPPQ